MGSVEEQNLGERQALDLTAREIKKAKLTDSLYQGEYNHGRKPARAALMGDRYHINQEEFVRRRDAIDAQPAPTAAPKSTNPRDYDY